MNKNIIRFGFLSRLLQDFKLLFPLIRDYFKGTYRAVSLKSIIIFLAGLIYIISPFDFIPDYIPGLGQIDDVAILAFCLYLLEKDLLKYEKWRQEKS
jgi:uncharacterized membrane protein YkvA (DUF1232 family)